MTEVENKTEKPKRIFYTDFNDIPIGNFEKLGYTVDQLMNMDKVIGSQTLTEFRQFINILVKEGEPIGPEMTIGELKSLKKMIEGFLANSRQESAKEKLKENRSPKH